MIKLILIFLVVYIILMFLRKGIKLAFSIKTMRQGSARRTRDRYNQVKEKDISKHTVILEEKKLNKKGK